MIALVLALSLCGAASSQEFLAKVQPLRPTFAAGNAASISLPAAAVAGAPLSAPAISPAAAAPAAAVPSAPIRAAVAPVRPAGRTQLDRAAISGERAGALFDGAAAADGPTFVPSSSGGQLRRAAFSRDARVASARPVEKKPTAREARRFVAGMIAMISAGFGGFFSYAASFSPAVSAGILASLPVAYWALKRRSDLGEDLIDLPILVVAASASAGAVVGWAGQDWDLGLAAAALTGAVVGCLMGLWFSLKNIPLRDRD